MSINLSNLLVAGSMALPGVLLTQEGALPPTPAPVVAPQSPALNRKAIVAKLDELIALCKKDEFLTGHEFVEWSSTGILLSLDAKIEQANRQRASLIQQQNAASMSAEETEALLARLVNVNDKESIRSKLLETEGAGTYKNLDQLCEDLLAVAKRMEPVMEEYDTISRKSRYYCHHANPERLSLAQRAEQLRSCIEQNTDNEALLEAFITLRDNVNITRAMTNRALRTFYEKKNQAIRDAAEGQDVFHLLTKENREKMPNPLGPHPELICAIGDKMDELEELLDPVLQPPPLTKKTQPVARSR